MHLDPRGHYGGAWSTFSLKAFDAFLKGKEVNYGEEEQDASTQQKPLPTPEPGYEFFPVENDLPKVYGTSVRVCSPRKPQSEDSAEPKVRIPALMHHSSSSCDLNKLVMPLSRKAS